MSTVAPRHGAQPRPYETAPPLAWPARQPTGGEALWQRWLVRLSWINLALVVVAMLLICFVSEQWWLSGVLTYLPRAPLAFPAIVLLAASLLTRPKLAWIQLMSIALVAVPIMGLTLPIGTAVPAPAAGRTPLRIISGNLQEGQPSLIRAIDEINRFEPDIIVLQETARGCEDLDTEFASWDRVHLGPFFVASRYPVRVVDHCRAKAFDRWSCLLLEVETPDGLVLVANVHLMTPRHGATGINVSSPITGDGVDEFEWHQELRLQEAAETREFLESYHDRPLILCGDFNTPSTSTHYAANWSGLQNSFDLAGHGYGYTSPCNTNRVWPSNTPWVRIDHILADAEWAVHDCRIGTRDASDHRLMFAELSLK
ncbi:MAG: endonuclease/exonuclease/phosphatase family protein [Planctomycetaceae bacterium]